MAASAQDLTARISAKITGQAVASGYEFKPPTLRLAYTFNDTLADGTGADQANQVYQDLATLAADQIVSYDLAGGLTDEFGGTVTFTKIKTIMLLNTSTTASVLAIGGGTGGNGTNAFDTWCRSQAGAGAGDGSERVLVGPGGVFLLYRPDVTGYAVTAGTGDILIIEEESTLAASYELTLIGVV